MKSLAVKKKGILGYSFLLLSKFDKNGKLVSTNAVDIEKAGILAKDMGCDYFEVKPAFDLMHYLQQQDIKVTDITNNQLKAIKKLNSDIAFIDSCDIKPKRFKIKIKSFTEKKIKIYSLHKADEIYTIVSAASILAKYIRDKEIYKLQRRYGLIGSGYPSDNKTRLFLKTWTLKNRNHPNFTRKSWKTWDKICNE